MIKEKKFNLISCYSIDEETNDQSIREKSVLQCLNKLTGKIDAFYLTRQSGVNEKTVKIIVDWSIKNKIKTFSQSGSDEVKLGILLGTASSRFNLVGKFEAEGIAQVLNGVPISLLKQELISPIFVSFNADTAKKIGFEPNFRMMSVVEEIIR